MNSTSTIALNAASAHASSLAIIVPIVGVFLLVMVVIIAIGCASMSHYERGPAYYEL